MSAPSQILSDADAPFWRGPWMFAVHAIVGSIIFGIIAAAAAFLSVAVHRLQGYGTDVVIIIGLKAAEYGLFAIDLFLFAVFLYRTAKRTLKHL